VFIVSIPKSIFLTQPIAQLSKPHVIGQALTCPNRTRMIEMCLLVGVLRQNHAFLIPVSRIQELSCFKDHLYNMLVAMIFRGFFGIEREEEDVHFKVRSNN
jgi:hypothetical protein